MPAMQTVIFRASFRSVAVLPTQPKLVSASGAQSETLPNLLQYLSEEASTIGAPLREFTVFPAR
jgi:hypothetical protein